MGAFGCMCYNIIMSDSLDWDQPERSEENSSLGKQSPCWDGYVQRGMKPGEDGSMVPNCVPVSKQDSNQSLDELSFSNLGKDYTKSTNIKNIFI
jgi:hypothetical protein